PSVLDVAGLSVWPRRGVLSEDLLELWGLGVGTVRPAPAGDSAHPDPGCHLEGRAAVRGYAGAVRHHPARAGALVAAGALGDPPGHCAAPAALEILDQQWRSAERGPRGTLSRQSAGRAAAEPVWLFGGGRRCAVV